MRILQFIFIYLLKAPASALYCTGVYLRNKLYDIGFLKSQKFDFPLINVGNITVGGTGKTPHIEYITSILSKLRTPSAQVVNISTQQVKPAILSRGYKRKTKGFRYVMVNDTANNTGDEPLQMKCKFPDITVAVDANRVEGINRLQKEIAGLQTILLDDAFQHRRIKAGLNIVLIDYKRPIYNDKFLPWGHLRDNKSQLHRAEVIIVSKCPYDLQPVDMRMIRKYIPLYPYQQLYFTSLAYGDKMPVFDDIEVTGTLLQGEGAVALAGIASPASFVAYIEKHFGKTVPLLFPDHHDFTTGDIKRIVNAAKNTAVVLTTEKDSMRLRKWAANIPDEIKAKMFYIPVEVQFLKDEDKFIKLIFDYVKTNRSDSRLY